MKTTDRVLSFLLALVMVFSLFSPGLAYAEEPEEEGTIAPVEDPAPVPDDPAAPVGDGVLDVPPDDSDSTGSIAPAAETEAEVVASGVCGDRLGWILTNDGVLTISGDGAMKDYTWSTSGTTAPWYPYRAQIVEVVLPDGITTIGNQAFRSCFKMESINLPLGITSIGASAFSYCSALKTVTIPGTVQSMGGSAFYSCSGLLTLVIEEGVPALNTYAFFGCTSLTSVTLPQSLQTIKAQAFKNTTALTSITIPKRVTNIGTEAFANSGLTEVHFACFAPTFGTNVFLNCSLTAYYPGADITWTEEVRQPYGAADIRWVPVIQSYDLTIAGTQVTETNLSGLIDNTFAWRYEPDANTLHLQGSWTIPDDYAYSYVIWNSIPGLTISLDYNVDLQAPAGKTDFKFLILNQDTTITGNGNYSLTFVGANDAASTGIYVGGATLTLRDLKLYAYNNIRYVMDGGTSWQSALDLVSCSGILSASEAVIFRFPQGIDMDDCCFIQPFGAVIDSQGIVCESNSSTWATRVVLGQGPYPLGVAGVTVTESNKDNILGDTGRTFEFDSDSLTLYINGNWQSTANAPVIENYINGLTVVVASEYGALSSTSSSQSIRGLIESHGSMTIRPLETDAGYSLSLAGSGVFNRAGIHMYGDSTLTVQDMDLTITNTGYGLRGDTDGNSALRLERSRVSCEGIFTSGLYSFPNGVTLTGCGWAVPAYPKLSGGSLCIESWDGDQLVKDLLVHPTVYELVIDGTRVYEGNKADILGNGVFAYNYETNTLTISGNYSQPTATLELLKTYKVRPVIDSGLNELRIELGGDVTLTAALENYNSYTPIINSTGSRFFLRAAEGTETMPVLTLAGAGSLAFDGIHSKSLTVRDIDLRVGQGARKGRLGESGSVLTFINCCGDIWGYANDTGAAVTGYTGGISFDNCALVDGTVNAQGTIVNGGVSGRVLISNEVYDLYVDGMRLYAGRTNVLDGRAVYDPETNTLTLDGLGEAPFRSANLPYIENHIPGLTILVASGIELGTTTSANNRGLIESDQDLTITAPGDTGRLALDGIGSITNGVKMLNGADLTLQGVRVLVQNVENGLMGTAGSALTVSGSWVEIHAGTAAVNSFTQGITLEQDKITDPKEAYVDGARIYDPAISAPAKTVTITPPEHFHDEIDFLPWTGATSLPSVPGSYYLCNDVTLSETWTVPEGRVNLCLNGHTIHMAESQRVIKIPDNATLNLYDCRETLGEITGGYDSDGGGGVRVEMFGTLNLYGGRITGNSSG